MTDNEGPSPPPDDATSCGSACSRRSCSGCSISLRSPASSTWRMSGARSPRRARRAADLRRGVGRARRDVRPGPDSGGGQRRAVRTRARPVRDARRDGRHSDHHQPDRQARRQDRAREHSSAPERADRLDRLIQRRGLWAVVGQRFIPGVSDALASYAFGAFGVPLWQMAVGAFIGSVPRAFVYTALGASIGDLSSPLAYAADRHLVRDRGHRRVRDASRLPALAWAPSRRPTDQVLSHQRRVT